MMSVMLTGLALEQGRKIAVQRVLLDAVRAPGLEVALEATTHEDPTPIDALVIAMRLVSEEVGLPGDPRPAVLLSEAGHEALLESARRELELFEELEGDPERALAYEITEQLVGLLEAG
jgi:hypothetical protein